MRCESAGNRPVYGVAAALAALALSLAGCGAGSAGGPAGTSAGAGPTGTAGQAKAGSTPADSLALSHLKVLTELKQPQLCSLLSPTAVVRALSGPAATPAYSSDARQGVACQWVRQGAAAGSANELYVGISATIDWAGERAVDTLMHASPVTIDGHRALAVAWQATLGWAEVDVALGGDHDPVARYRAPTAIGALALAKAATPHILAFG
ncbi:MAG TPA: DUF3558 family protein [Streptosporangiaceae bacterium]|nr:DUF3558 family protein [Streptosporangiaceae bacterium]